MEKTTQLKAEAKPSEFKAYRVYGILIVFIAVASISTYFLYTKTQSLFRWSLDERMIAVASIASTRFDPIVLDKIKGPESIETEAYKEVVQKLQEIRKKDQKIKYVYLFRKTDDPLKLEFVADADSLRPDVSEDINSDGKIDEDDEKTYPGDPYDITDFPEFQRDAFVQPFVDPDLTHDRWGTFLSGTAPIESSNANLQTKYVIGLDLDVTEFEELANLALIPFALFVSLLLLILTTLTIILKRLWQTQVRLLAEIDKQKDDMLHMVTHQLRGPVTRINTYTELLLDGTFGELTSEQKENITIIREASQDMGNQTGTILAAAKIKADKLPIEPAPLDLNTFFRSITQAAIDQAKEHKVIMKISIPAKLPTVMLDRQFTQIVLDNLISNAIKYTALRWKGSGGNVDFSVKIENTTLQCTVKDTGIGIPDKDKGKVFGELFRASNSGTNGNGLGLYAAMRIIKAQGGILRFDSQENKGTTFFVELPLTLVDENSEKKDS